MKNNISLMLILLLMTGNIVFSDAGISLPGDVPPSQWTYDSVKTAATDGWLVLDDAHMFRPEAPANRAWVAQLLAGAWPVAEKQGKTILALPKASACVTLFSDLETASPEVQTAFKRLSAAGVLSGYPGGLIKPEGAITRIEMASLLSRVCKDAGTLPQVFTDQAQLPLWGRAAADKASAMGLVTGYGDGTFRPFQVVTHGEALQMVSRWVYPQMEKTTVSRGETDYLSEPMTADVLMLVNGERTKRGLSLLHVDAKLTELARFKASAMASGNYFSHISPSGEDTKSLFERFGFVNKSVGENLLRMKGNISAEKAVAAWMQSPTHRDILLTPYTDTGIGFARAADGTAYIAEAFGAL